MLQSPGLVFDVSVADADDTGSTSLNGNFNRATNVTFKKLVLLWGCHVQLFMLDERELPSSNEGHTSKK